MATAFATTSDGSATATVTLTFASGSWQIEFAVDGTKIASTSGTYSIALNYEEFNGNPTILLTRGSTSRWMILTYGTSSMTSNNFTYTIYDSTDTSKVLLGFSNASLTFNKQ